ncbi:MAG: transposase [Cyanothece sp. SIO1E1]|nr:transposase [Cyanothece sp. SIO1E1]
MDSVVEFFQSPQAIAHKQYEALRAFYVEGKAAAEVAQQFGYTLSAFYSLTRDFKQRLKEPEPSQQFFVTVTRGRKPKDSNGQTEQLIITLRQKHLSVPDIKAILDSQNYDVSEGYIYKVIAQAGFERLTRRNKQTRDEALAAVTLAAPQSQMLVYTPETFNTQLGAGVLCLLPYLQANGIAQLIEQSQYPATHSLNRLSSILSFVALKLSNMRRYSADDLWCMDRGLGLFAGLNVLPKAAWFSSYSHRVTRQMNLAFLKSLHGLWQEQQLLSDTANLDFVTIPYWGQAPHLENNWSSNRNQSLSSILAVLAQDPDTGIITYGDTNIRHSHKGQVVLEFLDFYSSHGQDNLKYLVFDSQFTTYQNLKQLDEAPNPIKFITIRKRGKQLLADLNALPSAAWKRVRVSAADGKGRYLKVHEQIFPLKGYGKNIRQVAIAGQGKIKPALLITNDFELSVEALITKYARRWLVEQEISEQIHFFHLNRVSSSMVIKVDFDLTISILAHNLYRLLANDLPGFTHSTSVSLFDKFICNSGRVQIDSDTVTVLLKKKRNLPALLTALERFQNSPIPWMQNRKFQLMADTTS